MKKNFTLKIHAKAFDDIQNAIDFYNDRQMGLGKRFHFAVKKTFATIKKNPVFQIRYDNIRCLLVKKFPYMVHFSIDGDIINVRAVIHTSLDPETHWVK